MCRGSIQRGGSSVPKPLRAVDVVVRSSLARQLAHPIRETDRQQRPAALPGFCWLALSTQAAE
jgi:hypothetical protein